MLITGETAHLSEKSEALFGGACWYALHTYPRHEKRVRERLSYLGVESFLPLYETVNQWKNGCKMRVQLPLFPNYVFAQTAAEHRGKVLAIPGVIGFVGSGFEPWPLPKDEIEKLRDGLHLRKPQPHSYLVSGQQVEIKNGPLTGLSGIVVRTNGGLRVVLSVDLLMQSVSVEVSISDINPVTAAPPPLAKSYGA